MSLSAVAAALQDALEKGDVVELEQAIVAAEDATHVSPHSRKSSSSSSSLGNLIARAKDMYLVHMDACRPYVKPLRKACKELNERGIFEALVRARGAPDEVQLCMYTDLCNAETLRHEIVEAQKVAVQLLDATSSEEVDNFLNECSPFLEDRTVLSLVQKREDLLREEKRREAGRVTPLRSVSRGGGSAFHSHRRDPLEDLGRYELEDEGMPPAHAALRHSTPSRPAPSGTSRHLLDSGRRGAAALLESITPRSTGAVPTAYSAIRHAMDKACGSNLERAVADDASPWMQAMRSLRQQVYEEVAREERNVRHQLMEVETDFRAKVYRSEMLERVRCWADTTMFPDDADDQENKSDALNNSGEAGCEVVAQTQQDAGAAERQRVLSPAAKLDGSLVRLPSPSDALLFPSSALTNGCTGNTPTRVYAHSLSAYPLRPSQQQLVPTPLTRTPRSGVAEEAASMAVSSSPAAPAGNADGAILGSALRARLAPTMAHSAAAAAAAVLQNTPRISRDTPNISPIKEMSTTSGVASMWENDALYHRADTKAGWGEGGLTERGATPCQRDSVGSIGTSSSSVVSAMTASFNLELRRIQARLRAVLQEEDIHRRDIEGTEDFDRSVFLFPVSARIAMLRRTATNRLRL